MKQDLKVKLPETNLVEFDSQDLNGLCDRVTERLKAVIEDAAKQFIQSHGKGWKNEFGEKYGIQSIPRMWLVDKKGMVVDTEARTDLVAKVGKLLAE